MKLTLTLRAVAIVSAFAIGEPAHAQLQIALNPKPQFSGDSCRAYGLALAVGTLPASPFPVANAKQLREAERQMQAKIKALGGADGASNHEIWRKAVDELSSGKLELVLEYPATYEAVYARIRELTKVKAADTLGALMTVAVGSTPVMTSVLAVGNSTYSTGHIVSVYGVSAQPVTPTPLCDAQSGGQGCRQDQAGMRDGRRGERLKVECDGVSGVEVQAQEVWQRLLGDVGQEEGLTNHLRIARGTLGSRRSRKRRSPQVRTMTSREP